MIAGFHFLSSSMWHGWVRCFAFLLDSPENVPSVISGKRWGFNEEHVQQKHLQCLKFLHLVPWGRVKNIKSLCERMCWLSVTGAEDGLWDLSHASRKTVFCTLCLLNPPHSKIKSNLFLLFSTHSCPDPPPTAFHRLTLPVPDQTPAGLDTWLLLRKQSKVTPLLRNPHRHFS